MSRGMKDLKDLVQSSRLDDPATESAPPQARHAPGELPDSVMSKQLAKLRALAESDREIISTLQERLQRQRADFEQRAALSKALEDRLDALSELCKSQEEELNSLKSEATEEQQHRLQLASELQFARSRIAQLESGAENAEADGAKIALLQVSEAELRLKAELANCAQAAQMAQAATSEAALLRQLVLASLQHLAASCEPADAVALPHAVAAVVRERDRLAAAGQQAATEAQALRSGLEELRGQLQEALAAAEAARVEGASQSATAQRMLEEARREWEQRLQRELEQANTAAAAREAAASKRAQERDMRLQGRIKALEAREAAAKQQASATGSTAESLQRERDDLAVQVAELQQRVETQEAELAATTAALTDAQSSATVAAAEAKSQRARAEEEEQSGAEARAQASAAVARAEQAAEQHAASVAALRAELEASGGALRDALASAAKLQSQVEEAAAEAAAREVAVSALQQQAQAHETEMQALAAELQRRAQTEASERSELQTQLAAARGEARRTADSLQQVAGDAERYKRSMEARADAIRSATAKLRHAEEALKNELTCSECLCVFTDPVSLPDCGHNFCRNCRKGYADACKECALERGRSREAGGDDDTPIDSRLTRLCGKFSYVEQTLAFLSRDALL